jgi:DNA (cytosine-5)-methyltransferase 1
MKDVHILELFGGIGSPRIALRNIGIPVKAIDYVEIDEAAVRSYNAMFADELKYKTQSVVGWNLKPDILIHGSPCQDFSIAGQRKGADKGSETRSSLMWETIHIIQQMGEWKPKYVIWENVKNVLSKRMIANFNRYQSEMAKMGYSNSYEILDARDFGLPQARERVFTISVLDGEPFYFDDLIRSPMRNVWEFIQPDDEVPDYYTIKSPSMKKRIFPHNYDNAPIDMLSVIKNYAMTITTSQDRCPNSGIIQRKNGEWRLLTELECWRLQGYSDEDFYRALKANPRMPGKKSPALYKQAGNSIAVPIFESIFRKIILGETESCGQLRFAI